MNRREENLENTIDSIEEAIETVLSVDELLDEAISTSFQLNNLSDDLSETLRDIEMALQRRPTKTAAVMISSTEALIWDGRMLMIKMNGAKFGKPLISQCGRDLKCRAAEHLSRLLEAARS